VNSSTAYAYCRALAGSSARVRLFTIGRSEEGRDIVLLAVADEKGIQELGAAESRDRRAGGSAPHDAAAAAGIVASAPDLLLQRGTALGRDRLDRVVLELAYRLAVSEQPMIRRIRENLVC